MNHGEGKEGRTLQALCTPFLIERVNTKAQIITCSASILTVFALRASEDTDFCEIAWEGHASLYGQETVNHSHVWTSCSHNKFAFIGGVQFSC